MNGETVAALQRQAGNDNSRAALPVNEISPWPERIRRAGDVAGEWIADAFVIGGVFLLLVSAGWL